jgi:hypothetical protein
MPARLRLPRFFATLISLAAPGCATLYMQDDGFRQELAKGCTTEAACQALSEKAAARLQRCEPNTVGRVKCSDAQADDRQARSLLAPYAREREAREREIQEQKWGAERQARMDEYNARKEAEKQAHQEARAAGEREMEERRRAADDAQAKAEADRVARLAELRALSQQKKYAVPVASALLCHHQDWLKGFQKDCANQRRIDRLSGTVDLSDKRACAEEIDASKTAVRCHERALARHKARAEVCNGEYEKIEDCTHKGNDDRCAEPYGTYAEILAAGVMDCNE